MTNDAFNILALGYLINIFQAFFVVKAAIIKNKKQSDTRKRH
jgi:hypothetical protein